MLTRDKALSFDDITTKQITVPESIPVWGGETLYIKQLTRGQQDAYNNRLFASMRMKQEAKGKHQDITGMTMYGHDAWLVVQGAVDENGAPLFKASDIDELNKKSGEAIGWIAKEIVLFSGMADDVEEEIKN